MEQEQAGSSTSTSTGEQPLSPDELCLLQLMICAMRASSERGGRVRGLEAAARRFIAWQTRQDDAVVHALWCGLRASSLRKLREHLTRGDYTAGGERLSALEWAVVDLLLLYDTPLLSVASFQYRAQLQALERTFELVQRFRLEPEHGRPVSPARWSRAAHRYCRNGVQLSAVALQRRWHELKLDARRRACAPAAAAAAAAGSPRPLVLPIHQAVINRYPHVVESSELLTWPELVAAGRVADPTNERGPAPGDTCTSRPNSPEHSDGPTKSVETIDLSDDEESQGNTLVEAKNSFSNYTPVITVSDVGLSPNNTKKENSLFRTENINQSKTDPRNIVLEKCMNVIVKPEIIEIDENAPSPTDNVVEAMQEVDINNVDATVIYEEEDVKHIIDIQMGNVDRDAPTATVASDDDENIKVKIEIVDDLFLGETVIHRNNTIPFTQIKDSNENNTTLDNFEAQIHVKEETTNELDETNNKPVCEVDSKNVNNLILGHKLEDFNLVDQLKLEILTKVESNLDENIVNHSDKDNINIVDREVPHIKTERSDDDGESNDRDIKPFDYNEKLATNNSNDSNDGEHIDTVESINADEITEVLSTIKTETNFNNEDKIDPKLLMLPVILLRRIDDPISEPPKHRSSQNQTLFKSYSQIFFEKNKEMLRRCKPCEVPVRRVDEEWVADRKRVRLPDMDVVRRNNRGLLTAEVAPVAPRLIDPNANKRFRPNMPYNYQSVRPSIMPLPSSEPPPLIPLRPLVPPPWTQNLGAQSVSISTDQNPSTIDPALQPNYHIMTPDHLLQNNQDSSQRDQPLQNKNLPLQNSLTNPMMQAQNTPNWSNSLQQQNATQNVFAQTRPPWSRKQAATVNLAPNISTQNITPPNLPLLNWPPVFMTGMPPTNIPSGPCITIDGTLNARGLTDLQRNYPSTQTNILPAGQIINSQLSPSLANQVPNPMIITPQIPKAMLVNPIVNQALLCNSFQPQQMQTVQPSQIQTVPTPEMQTLQSVQVQTLEPPQMEPLQNPQTQTVQTAQMLTPQSSQMHEPPQIRMLQPPRIQPLPFRMRTLQQPPHMLKLQPLQTQTLQTPQMQTLRSPQVNTLQPSQNQASQLPQMPKLQPAQVQTLQPPQMHTLQLPQMPTLQAAPIEASTSNRDTSPVVDGPKTNVKTASVGKTDIKRDKVADTLPATPIKNLFTDIASNYDYNYVYKSSDLLDWSQPPLTYAEVFPQRPDVRRVLCTGARPWRLRGRLLVSEHQQPPARAAIWTLRPRVRLKLPGDGKAPLNVRYQNRLYQKISDQPRTYAMMLTAVDNVTECRRLLSRGCKLLLYCLRTCTLHPIDAQRLSDGSFVLTSGNNTEAPLAELTLQLQRLRPLAPKPSGPQPSASQSLWLQQFVSEASGPQPSTSGPSVPGSASEPCVSETGAEPSVLKPLMSETFEPKSSLETFAPEALEPKSFPSEPIDAETFALEPLELNPSPSEPLDVEPFALEPLELKPSPSEPLDAEPFALEPLELKPSPSEPLDAEPFALEPLELKPSPSEPLDAEPFALEPLELKPSPSEPLDAEPFALEPLELKPSLSEPLDAEASESDLLEPQPSTSEPMSPRSSSSEPLEPKPSTCESLLPKPSSSEPLGPKPSTSEPFWPQPLLSGPLEPKPSSPEPESCPPKPNEPVSSASSLPMFSTSSAPVAPMLPALISAQLRPPASVMQTENESASMLVPSSAASISSGSIPTATSGRVASTSSRAVRLQTLRSAPRRPIKPVIPEGVEKDEHTHVDYFILSEEEFVAKYRLPKACVRKLGEDLKPYIRSYHINKVLACLRYLCTDAEQEPAVDSVQRVLLALNHNDVLDKYVPLHEYVSVTDRARREAAMRRFKELYHLPNVLGVIDGIQVPLGELPAAPAPASAPAPAPAPGPFLNRAGFHSLNVQLVCDADLNIFSADCSQGGAVHDGDIWAASGLRYQLQHLQALGETVWLLGDMGYLQRETLMTPFPSPSGPSALRYNFLHAAAWGSVRRCVHRLRSRWRRLTTPLPEKKASRIINACVVLHNIAEKANAPVPKDISLERKQKKINDLLDERQEKAVVSLVTAPDRERLLLEWKKGTEARERLVAELDRSGTSDAQDR